MKNSKPQTKRERKRILKECKRRIERRLRKINWDDQPKPMLTARNIHYELADRGRAMGSGGIGVIHMLARRTGLIDAIDEHLHLLKIHKPYHESDHVLNITYNLMCGGHCLEDIERLRNDEVYLDALGAQRIPDPTTAGDFCRRFEEIDVEILMEIINDIRIKIWKRQHKSFLEEAIIDGDGVLASTTGECKEGMDISYKGDWGYHPLAITLANTGEPLYLVNRSGNRPSHEGAAFRFDRSIDICRRAGFRSILLRGDTDFSQTQYLDGWDADNVRFVFGIDAMPNLVELADKLPETRWKRLKRPAKYQIKTVPRRRPANVKERIVVERGFKNIRLKSEDVAEFTYQPTACKTTYRVVVVRKNLSIEKGEAVLFDDIRYFFYITNDRKMTPSEVVFCANARCNQENLLKELKSGVHALGMPVDNLVSNWAYMVMASLAWTLKAWLALSLPETGRWASKHQAEKQNVLRMRFRTFVNAFVRVPCQIVRSSRRVVYRLLSWNRWQGGRSSSGGRGAKGEVCR